MDVAIADPELLNEFLTETNELLDGLDNDLVDLESDTQNADLLNRIFRAIHTIKGTSSFLGFDQLVEMGHAAEDVLHLMRNGERLVTPHVMDVLLESTDKIKILVEQIQNNDIKPIEMSAVLERLEKIKSGESGESGAILQDSSSEPENEDVKKPDEPEDSKDDEPDQSNDQKTAYDIKQGKKQTIKDRNSGTIRVAVDRLDDLMNLVGELVLERNRLLQVNREFRVNKDIDDYAEKVVETTEKIHFITSEIQISVLKTRMIPIDRLFRKYPRMVRDIAKDMKKQVELVISGGETELDKTVIDQLSDPMVHLIRNSIDHGIEAPEIRKNLGKTSVGRLELSASQEGNHIHLSIKDDGKGIDVESVRMSALKKGLINEAQSQIMGKQDMMQLIFEPGFSTAKQLSNISGRGVGMDVVRTNIRNLNGIIDVNSEINLGTEIVLKLPLTLAVIQALMVRVGKGVYAIPLASVIETVRISSHDIKQINQHEVFCHRDLVIPLLYLNCLYEDFSQESPGGDGNDNGNKPGYVVLIGVAEKKFGLIVDKLLGQEEVVIKSLGEYLGTITGDGRVRLIVDCGTVADLI